MVLEDQGGWCVPLSLCSRRASVPLGPRSRVSEAGVGVGVSACSPNQLSSSRQCLSAFPDPPPPQSRQQRGVPAGFLPAGGSCLPACGCGCAVSSRPGWAGRHLAGRGLSAAVSLQGKLRRGERGGRRPGAQGALGAQPGGRGGAQPAAGGAHRLPAHPAAAQEGASVSRGGRGARPEARSWPRLPLFLR